MRTELQVAIDCADPDRLARFWAEALHYQLREPPGDFADWREYYLSIGVPENEAGPPGHYDRIVDPDGTGPAFWFQAVPEPKTVKNRVHLDLKVSGGRKVPLDTRRERVDAEVARLLALGAKQLYVLSEDGVDHYGVTLQDPEGNEFCVA